MPYRPGDRTMEFEGKIEHETEKAYLVIPTIGPPQIWVPKSQMAVKEPEFRGEGNYMFEVAEWWYNNSNMKEYQ